MSLLVGIDLGTSNCALAFADPSEGSGAKVKDFQVPQLARPGELRTQAMLPSCAYLPGPHELPDGALSLPWERSPSLRGIPFAVGEFARWQGARVPGRLISSAKSWLCHAGVDRQAPILPWGAPAEVAKISPVEASSLYLAHLAAAWAHAHPESSLLEQEIVITVPASFDEAARALTVSAAKKAGLSRFTLLEEPQAALYAFTAEHRQRLSEALLGVHLVLVVDVGGGTTDFTLVQVEAHPEGPALKRLAVGDHLMLGGDNMDAAIARALEERLLSAGKRLPATAWTQLTQAARNAKEALLGSSPAERHTIAIATGGSKLMGGTLTAELARAEVESLLTQGFFPRCDPREPERRGSRVALQELGLPYAQDPAITRHLAAFLRAHASSALAALGRDGEPSDLPRPDAILLNGGVFNSPVLAKALVESVSAFWPSAPPIPLLPNGSLDLAVARGAAYYALTRRGLGKRIGGGAARAYYVGLGGDSAVCLIPRGFEEGQSVELSERAFQLTLGRPVQLQLHATSADRIDKAGDVVKLEPDLFRPLPPIHTVLKAADAKLSAANVHLTASLTEIGTLELAFVASDLQERWRLEFELRGMHGPTAVALTESMPARFAEATELIHRVYGHKPLPVGPKDVKNLGRALEKVLGPREGWRLPVLRELWGALHAGAGKRRRSADHERVYFQLLGFSLRPGFGYPLDEWRAEQSFALFPQLVTHHQEKAVWSEFWILWRRISGGLSESAQLALWEYLRPHLARRIPPEPAQPKERLKGIVPEGLEEMVRTAASLEHLDPQMKAQLGEWIEARLKIAPAAGGPWCWALGRLGARAPLYGSGHRTVAPELAMRWAELLLELGLRTVEGAPFALTQLVRATGDRTREVDEDLRTRAIGALQAASAPANWLEMVRAPVSLSVADEARALGDTLPPGLQLA